MVGDCATPDVRAQVLPQLPSTSCQHDPTNICWFICCTVDTLPGPYGVPTISCTKDWVCGHRAPRTGGLVGIPGTGGFFGY